MSQGKNIWGKVCIWNCYTYPSKVWGAERRPAQEKEILLNTYAFTYNNVFCSTCNRYRYNCCLNILYALANVHHNMCNKMIGFEQWCHLGNLFIAVWQQYSTLNGIHVQFSQWTQWVLFSKRALKILHK